MNRSKRIMISCDFGTTYSGVAYSNPANETDDPILLTRWGRLTSDKCPTVVSYKRGSAPANENLLTFKWGPQVKQHEARQEWFKLGIESLQYAAQTTVDLSQKYPSTLEEPPHYEKQPRNIAIDFLRSLCNHVLTELAHKFGQPVLNTLRVEWIITVPAIWSPTAKNTTKEIALAAGMGNETTLQITSEPEAAAAYALRVLQPHDMEVNDNIVICDAGGGTVDLVSYRIKKLLPLLEVEESGVPSGGKCGSAFLNRIFEKHIDDKLRGTLVLEPEARAEMMRHFENFTKREFSNEEEDEDDDVFFPVPGLPDNRNLKVMRGRMALTSEELRAIFDEVIKEIIVLVAGQINGIKGAHQTVKAVLLVGGFGQSYYLKTRLEEEFPTIEILVPPNAWTAVARGAVLKGLSKFSEAPIWSVRSRVAQGSYGVECDIPYNKNNSLHTSRKKTRYLDPCDGVHKLPHSSRWFIQRGDDLSEKVSAKFDFWRDVPCTSTNFKFNDVIYHCFSDPPPIWSDDASCYKLATLKTDFSSIPKWQYETKLGKDGLNYYRILYTVHAIFHSAHFEVWTEFKGQSYGNTRVKFDQSSNAAQAN